MFAYCRNNPINACDSTGLKDYMAGQNTSQLVMVMALGVAACVVITDPEIIQPTIDEVNEDLQKAKKEFYEYAQKVVENTNRKTPHIHHIVPVGNFFSRNETTRFYIKEMHMMLRNAGIVCAIDPINLIVVSAETHVSLHTDVYIARVYGYLAATDGSKEQIYEALFYLRNEIAAMDSGAWGF